MKYFLIIILSLLYSCSSYDKVINYNRLIGTEWYIFGTQNNIDVYRFYRDSVIINQHQIDPKNNENIAYIIKRKLDIVRKDILYLDGDNYYIYLQEYNGYTLNNNGAKIKDNSQHGYFFISELYDSTMEMGIFDEYNDIQLTWTYYKRN